MRKLPDHICIVGGGTAGWLAALMLGDVARREKRALALTVIESSKIGGVVAWISSRRIAICSVSLRVL